MPRGTGLWRTALTAQLGIRYPIIQAGMAGGPTTPELVAAVCEAGGLGSLGAGYWSGKQLSEAIGKVRQLTTAPFAVNLFVPGDSSATEEEIAKAMRLVRVDEERFAGAIEQPSLSDPEQERLRFYELLDEVIANRVAVVSFTFGRLPQDARMALRQAGIYTMGTATTVHEAELLEADGIDCVIAQGSEAGGHRGSFAAHAQSTLIGSMALLPQVSDRVRVPVVAAGAIMDGRGIMAARALGAAGVQLGTAFLSCTEAGIHDAYRQALAVSTDESTVITSAFSGKPARGIANAFTSEWAKRQDLIAPYPLQNDITRSLRSKATAAGDANYMSLWAGQGSALTRDLSARELMAHLIEETKQVLAQLAAFGE